MDESAFRSSRYTVALQISPALGPRTYRTSGEPRYRLIQTSSPMAPHSSSVHRYTDRQVRRVYAINPDAPSAVGCCTLNDGSVVLCAFKTMNMAVNATAGDPSLRLVRHSDLSIDERKRVGRALGA